MPWPREYKSLTRSRIVEAAADALRAKGVAGAGVADIMASAGLTHGGFYAHFPSKDDLLSAALTHANRQTVETLSRAFESIPAKQRLQAVIDAYLSQKHAAHPERGCPVAALGPELVRAGGKVQRDLAIAAKRRIAWLRGLVPNQGRGNAADAQVVGALACMVGGLILARAVGGRDSSAVLLACRKFLHGALGDHSDAPVEPKRVAGSVRKVRAERRRKLARRRRAT